MGYIHRPKQDEKDVRVRPGVRRRRDLSNGCCARGKGTIVSMRLVAAYAPVRSMDVPRHAANSRFNSRSVSTLGNECR